MRTSISTLILLFPSVLMGQNYLSHLPSNSPNSRYYEDIFCDTRPCLTLDGFQGNYSSVDKVIERLFAGHEHSTILLDSMLVYSELLYSVVQDGVFDESVLNRNTLILQSQALIALLQYVSAKNGRDLNELNLRAVPSSNDAIATLKLALLQPTTNYLANLNLSEDHVKYTRSFMSYARALDLYLAIENAFEYYGEPDVYSPITRLLTKQQKNSLLVNAHSRSHLLYYTYESSLVQFGFGSIEAGNRPLKILTAAGYLALTLQDISQPDQDTTLTHVPNQVLWTSSAVQNAMQRNGPATVPYRYNNWAYQTDGGKRFWAEGPYYLEYALLDVLPFWHAVRQMGLLQTTSYGLNTNIADPFHSDWFLNPIEWLADISTPDGMTPPLDDGNKRSIRSASLLNWDNSYGRQNIGQKYAWVLQNRSNYSNSDVNHDRSLYILELAIPKTQTVLAAPDVIGTGLTGPNEQQVVVRFSDDHGNKHWLLVNGEYGKAITNGEGHEQPDQLQLLYYVNDKTYLKDSGYDHGDPLKNSNWNGYYHHNGISLDHYHKETHDVSFDLYGFIPITISSGVIKYENMGGLKSPGVSISLGHKVADHNEVSDLQIQTINSITHISGSVQLGGGTNRSSYKRNILLVRDSSNPYLVDFNRIFRNEGEAKAMRLIYHLPNYSSVFAGGMISDVSFNRMEIFSEDQMHSSNLNRIGFYVTEVESNQPYNIHVLGVGASEPIANTTGRKRIFQRYPIRELHQSVVHYGSIGLDHNSIRFRLYTPESSSEKSLNTISLFVYRNSQNELHTSKIIENEFVNSHTRVISWFPFGANSPSYNTVKDFAFKRRTDNPSFNSDVVYNLGSNVVSLRLSGGQEYGFIRLRLIDGIWTPDSNYKINIVPSSFYFASSQVLNESVIPSGTSIHIKDNVTLTINQPVTFESGTTVTLGTNASIVVSGSGKITANGTTFTSTDPTNPAVAFNRIELNTSGNSFTNSTFKGGNNQNVLVKKVGNTFTSCTFSHSKVGLSLFTVAAEAILKGSTITQNTQHGAYVDGGTLKLNGFYRRDEFHVDPTMEFWGQEKFNPTSIHGNTGNGVTLITTGKLYTSQSRIMDNTGIQISVGNDARMFAEELNHNQNLGLNRISKTTSGYYIYSTARTPSGETYQNWTIPARYNYWGGGSEPVAGRFFGPVDASSKRSADSTAAYIIDFCMVESCDVRGKAISLTSVMSSAMSSAIVAGSSTSKESERLIVTKERILAIRNHIASYPDDPFNARLLREWHGLLQSEGVSTWSDEKQLFAERLETRKTQHAADMVLAHNSGRRAGSGRETNAPSDLFRPDSELDPKHLIGETAWVLSLAVLADQGEYEELLDQSSTYGTRIFNADNRASVQVYRMQALQSLGRYEEAISALNELERIQPSADMQPHYIAQDYGPVRRYLAELAGVDVNATLAKSNATVDDSGTPHAFALHPSYPNPFNPTTTVRFTVAGGNGSSAQVRIAVFDLLGREVAVLVNERKQAGEYSHVFDASDVASGIYLIHARLGSQVFSHKITLIK